MALNPPITPTGVPLRVDQEFFVLHRKDMECEVKIDQMGKYTAKGKIYLTTCRIVFVNDNFQKESFKAFDFPLAFLAKEKFEQPIFGSNYLEGEVAPLYNLLPGKTHFKLWFKSGGCSMFLKMLVEILQQIRVRRRQGQMGPDPRWVGEVSRTQGQAYVDPNDPSVIYMVQPPLNQQSYGNTTWQVPAAGVPLQSWAPQQPQQNQPVYGQPIQPQYGQHVQPQYGQPAQQFIPPPQPQYQQPQQPQQYGQPQQPQQFSQPQQYQQPYQQLPSQQSTPNQSYVQSQVEYPPQQQPYQQPPVQQQGLQQPQQGQYVQQPQPQGQYVQQPQPQVQQPQGQQPQGQQPAPAGAQPNFGYYYGFFGPQLQNNTQNNQFL